MENKFIIDCPKAKGRPPVYLIGINGTFLDYEFSFEDIQILRNSLSKIITEVNKKRRNQMFFGFHEPIDKEYFHPDIENADPNSPFYNKIVVITGVFNSFSRESLAERLKALGADINGSISKNTQIVVVGDEPGPKKMEKISELNNSGFNIQILYEDGFMHVVDLYEKNKMQEKINFNSANE